MSTNEQLIDAWNAADTLNDRTALDEILKAVIPEGLQNKRIAFGTAAFVTSGTAVEVPCYTAEGLDIGVIDTIIAVPKATHDEAQEALFCDGVVTVGSEEGDNTTTVSRTAGTTSALGFFYLIIGTE